MSEFSRKISIYVESGQAQLAYDRLKASQQDLIKKVKEYVDAGKLVPAEVTEKLLKTNEALKKQSDLLSGKLTPSLKNLSGTYSTLKRELESMNAEDAGFELKRKQTMQAKEALEQYKFSLGSVKEGLKEMLTTAKGVAFGVVVGNFVQNLGANFMGAISAVGSAITGLDSSVQNLSAITGATGTELDFLKQKSIELASSGSRSAKDYVEAMKFIASAKPELLQNKEALVEVTKAAKLLATSGGLDLQDAAKRLTDALNQFGAPASSAIDYVDRLAAAAKYGSAEIPDITEALLQFGPIASQAGVSVNESAAAIELLAEKGYKGAEAGTKLRNILLNLSAVDALPKEAQEAMAKYGVNVNILKDNTLSLEERLKELSKVSGDATAMVQIFDKQNVSAATSLLTNVARYSELNEQIKENGVAQDQASKNTNTLSASWERLKNAITNIFLNINTSGLANIVRLAGDAVTAFGKWAGYIKSTSQLLEEERQQLLLTETQITSYNVGTEERTKLIQELQSKYPQMLANLDAEKATNEEIAEAINKVNNQLLYKIALAQKDEQLQKQLAEFAKTANATADLKASLEKEITAILNNEQLAKIYRDRNKALLEGLPIQTQAAALLNGAIELDGVSSRSLEKLASIYDKYTESVAKNNVQIDKKNELYDDLQRAQRALKETLGIQDEVATPKTDTSSASTSTTSKNSTQDKLNADLERFNQFYQKLLELKKQSEAALISEDEKEIAAVQIKYDALSAELLEFEKKGIINTKKFNETKALLLEDYYNELDRLNKKHFDKRSENEYEATLFATAKVFERELTAQKEKLAKGEINELTYNATVGAIHAQAIAAKITIAQDYFDTVKKAENDLVKFQQEQYEQDVKNKQDAEKRKAEAKKLEAQLGLETAQLSGDKVTEKSIKLRLLEEEYQAQMEHWSLIENGEEQHQETLNAITENYNQKRKDLAEDDWFSQSQNFAKRVEGYLGYAQQVVGVMNSISQIQTNLENAQLNSLKKNHDKKVKYYNEELKSKRLSQKQHDKLVDAANRELAGKEDEIKRRQFERNKAMQIVTAVINTAAAVASAWGTSGNIYAAIAMSVIAAAAGAAQIGVIASQQYQGGTYEEGTDSIANGPSHAQGGIKMIDSSNGVQIGEMEGDEAIINKRTVAANMPIIRKLLAAKGRPISVDVERTAQNVRVFETGTLSVASESKSDSTAGKVIAMDTQSYHLNNLLRVNENLLAEMKKFNAKKLSVSVQEINDKNDLLDYLTDKAI